MRLGLKLSPGALMLIVLGCAPPVLPGPHFSGTLAGRVTFDRVKVARNAMNPDQSVLDYENKEKWPVRETSIQVLSSSGRVVVEGFTDTDGNYCFSIEVDGPVKLRVKSVTRTPLVKVVDNTHGDALYALDSEAFAPNGRRFDMNAGCGWVGSNTGGNYSKARSAAPFAILDTIYTEEHAFLRDRPKINFDPLTVHWSPSNDSAMGTIESGHIGTSYFLDGSGLYLLGKEDTDPD